MAIDAAKGTGNVPFGPVYRIKPQHHVRRY